MLFTSSDIGSLFFEPGPACPIWLLSPTPGGNVFLAQPHTLSHAGGERLGVHRAADDLANPRAR